VVFKGIVDGRPVAVKTTKKNADKAYLKALLSELKIMIYLGNHEHIVQLVGASTRYLEKGLYKHAFPNGYILYDMAHHQ